MKHAIWEASSFLAASNSFTDIALELIDGCGEDILQTELISSTAMIYASHSSVDRLRSAAIAWLKSNASSPLALLRETSMPWKLVMSTFEYDGTFDTVKAGLVRAIRKVAKGRCNFLADDGEDGVTVNEARLLAAVGLVLQAALDMLMEEDNLPCLRSIAEVTSLLLSTRGIGTEAELSEETVVSSLFFLRILCPSLIACDVRGSARRSSSDSPSSGRRGTGPDPVHQRMMVWLSKSIMRGVATVLNHEEGSTKGARRAQALIAQINRCLLAHAKAPGGRSVPPPQQRGRPRKLKPFLLQKLLENTTLVNHRLAGQDDLLSRWDEHAVALVKEGMNVQFTYADVWRRVERKSSLSSHIGSTATSRTERCRVPKRRGSTSTAQRPRVGQRDIVELLRGSDDDVCKGLFDRSCSDTSLSEFSDASEASECRSSLLSRSDSVQSLGDDSIDFMSVPERSMVLKVNLTGNLKLVRMAVTPLTTVQEISREVASAFKVPGVAIEEDVSNIFSEKKAVVRLTARRSQ